MPDGSSQTVEAVAPRPAPEGTLSNLPSPRALVAVTGVALTLYVVANTLDLIDVPYEPWRWLLVLLGNIVLCWLILSVCWKSPSYVIATRLVLLSAALIVVGHLVKLLGDVFADQSLADDLLAFIPRVFTDVGMGLIALALVRMIVDVQRQTLLAQQARDEAGRALAQWRDSDHRFHAFMSALPLTAFIKDAAGRYLYVNPACEAAVKLPAESWRERTDLELFENGRAEQYRANDREVLRRGEALEFEEHTDGPDGLEIWTSVKFPWTNAAGQTFLGGASLNITHRKRLEQELLASRESLDLAMRAGGLGLWDWNVLTGDLRCNEQGAELLGYTLDELPLRVETLARLTHPDDIEPSWQIVLAHLRGQSPQIVCECRLLCRDGSWRWALIQGRTVEYAAHGRALRIVGILRDIENRKRAEEERETKACELSLVRDRYEAAIAASHQVVFEWNSADDQFTWAGMCEELFGYSPQDMPRSTAALLELLHQDDRAMVIKQREMLLTAQRTPTLRARIRHRAGHDVYTITRAGPIARGPAGSKNVVGFISDISRQVRAESASRESEERFRLLADSAPVMIWMADANSHCTYLNRAWLEYTGLGESEQLGEGWADVMHPDDRERELARYHQAVARRESFRLEYRARRHDGIYRWIFDHGAPRFDRTGLFVGYVGACLDIHELRMAEESSRRASDFREAVIRTAAEGVCVFQPVENGTVLRFTVWNDRMEEITGYTMAEINELDFARTLYRDAAQVERMRRNLQDWPQGQHLEGALREIVRRDGQRRTLSISTSSVKADDGAAACVALIQDVTEKQRAEAELARYRDQLLRLVDERTAELEQSREQLRQAERLAAVGTLAAGIAHEINNPVGTILLSAQVQLRKLAERPALDDTRAALDSIVRDAKRCGIIVHNVLRFARQQPSDRTPAPLNGCVQRSVELVRSLLARRGIKLVLRLADDLPPVCINATEIEQVLVNLLCNAAEASPPDGPIEVATGCTADRIWLSVADQGHGMSEEVRRRLFDPFYTTRRREGGTGLGLSIAYGIIRDHEGTLRVASEIGRGTTMTFELPAIASWEEVAR